MPLDLTVSPRGVIRTTGLIPASSDHSFNLACWSTTIPAAGLFGTFWYYGDPVASFTDYIWIGRLDTGELRIDIGALAGDTVDDPGFGYFLLSYERTGSIHKVYVNGHLVSTLVADISAWTIAEEYIGTDTGSWVLGRYKDFREWDSSLTSDELIIEAGLTTPVIAPWCSTPLNGDLLDISGNGRNWSFSGGASVPWLIDGNMKQVMQGSSPLTVLTSQTTYLSLNLGGSTTSLGGSSTPFKEDCILRNLNIEFSDAPGVGAYWDLTLVQGLGSSAANVDTLATFRVSDLDTFGSYTLSDISFTAGQWAFIRLTPSIGPAPATTGIIRFGWEQVLTDKFHSQFFIGNSSSSINSYAEKFNGIFCGSGMWSRDIDGGPDDNWTICPLTGVITGITYQMKGGETFNRKLNADFVIWKSEDAGATWVVQDGSGGTPNTEVFITPIGTTGTGCYLLPNQAWSQVGTDFQLVVRRGDLIYIQEVTNVACGGQFNANFAFTFRSSISNAYPLCGRSLSLGNTSSYKNFWGASNVFGFAAGSGRDLSNGGYSSFTLGQWIGQLTNTPGAGKVRNFTGHVNLIDSTLQLTFNNGDFVVEDNTHFMDVVFGDTFGIHSTATSGTGNTEPIWGIVSSIAPTEGGGGGGGTGQITVIKVTLPTATTSFDFDAVNLDPVSFSLADGESIVFPDLNAGSGYSVIEQDNPLYGTIYTVSNGSSNEDITVAEDESVLVTVTNTLLYRPSSGIYKIVPGKRQDTLWVSFDPQTTEDVKIPRPAAKGAYLGE